MTVSRQALRIEKRSPRISVSITSPSVQPGPRRVSWAIPPCVYLCSHFARPPFLSSSTIIWIGGKIGTNRRAISPSIGISVLAFSTKVVGRLRISSQVAAYINQNAAVEDSSNGLNKAAAVPYSPASTTLIRPEWCSIARSTAHRAKFDLSDGATPQGSIALIRSFCSLDLAIRSWMTLSDLFSISCRPKTKLNSKSTRNFQN